MKISLSKAISALVVQPLRLLIVSDLEAHQLKLGLHLTMKTDKAP
ncbi:MAG: hypothetical protein AAFY21_20470 [Cyanobacteria bacterium J06641_2]